MPQHNSSPENKTAVNEHTENHQSSNPQEHTLSGQDTTHQENKSEASNPIIELMSGLGDHREFSYGPWHGDFLPVIIYDNGFHFYSGNHAMEKSGKFKMEHHHVVRAGDGKAPQLDLTVTNLVSFQWMAMIFILIAFFTAAKKYKKNPTKAPSGFQNMLEAIVLFIRNDVVEPNIPSKRASVRLLPYFVVLFFFILVLNLLGLLPGGHTATGTVGTTAALAVTAFIIINITAIREAGIKAWFVHLLGGAPWYMAIIMVPIEIMSMFIKPFSLTIRLFANMAAGHIVLYSLIGLLFLFQTLAISPVIVGFSLFINLLEVMVAFLQAFIFTMLTAIFIGLAIGDHAHHDEHDHAHAH